MAELIDRQLQSDGIRRRYVPPAWAVLLAACVGQFLVVLDVSVVNVALPSIRAELGLSVTGLQWVVNAYALTFAGFLLLGGRAADLFGRKRMFLVGLGLFTLASLAGGLSQQPWQLVTARAVQGLGAAVLSPATLTILTTNFPHGHERTKAIATWTAVGAGGGAAGALVGGVLTDFLSWRWVLLVNVPVGALVLVLAAWRLAESRDTTARRRLDVPGALLVTGGVAALAYGIVESGPHGWGAAGVLLPILGGVLLLAVFALVETRTKVPLIPLGLFRSRSVTAGNAVMLVCSLAMFSMWYFMSLYLQNVLHYSPLRAGFGFLPYSTAIILGSKLAPRIMVRVGGRTLAVAAVLMEVAGFLWQSRMTDHGTYLTTILGPALLMSFGAGVVATVLAATATSGVAPSEAGLSSGLVNTSRQMGGAIGLTILSTVAAGRVGSATTTTSVLAAGYGRVYLVAACFLLSAAVIMVLALPRAPRPAKAA